MEALTISQVSKDFGVSTRMLRYYEQTGLLKSHRREDYAYRMYDEEAVSRLRQILLLRRLRIPVKQIKRILTKQDAVTAIEVFTQNIRALDGEIDALSVIKGILCRLVDDLRKAADIKLPQLLLDDDYLAASVASLTPSMINFKEDKTMDSLKKAEETLSKLTDVRIVYLPPATVAAAHYIGDDPENHAGKLLSKFVRETELCSIKPDVRCYGFNHPNPVDETGYHGYEVWVTIPEDMAVPAPLTKKHFPGGMYAAHMITMGNFNEWDWLFSWVGSSAQYEFNGDMEDQAHMCGLLEEILNYVTYAGRDNTVQEEIQLDLLAPVRLKKQET
jgi:DNA-binding transcriptional MerR regulator/DNA gyrase inhibitor GyrI